MNDDKAIRAAKLTLGGILEKNRAKQAQERAPGQIAPSKYMPNVPRAVHATGGYVPAPMMQNTPRLAVAFSIEEITMPVALDNDVDLIKEAPLDDDAGWDFSQTTNSQTTNSETANSKTADSDAADKMDGK